MHLLVASLRIVVATLGVCVIGYAGLILIVAQALTPHTANGWLVAGPDGEIVGSSQIAQGFTLPEYFWPRPSAVDYDAAGAGGSNKSPTSPELTERAVVVIARHGASAHRPLPPELAAASAAGLDPHISEHAALYQSARVATARGMRREQVEDMVRARAYAPGRFLTPERIVNVLELNLALDALTSSAR